MFGKIINTFGTKTLTAVINLVIAIILSQVLGAEGKGTQGIIITTISFILVFSNLVGGATLVYLVPRYRYNLLLLPSYLWSVFIASISALLLYIFKLVATEFIIHISVLSLVSSFASINSSLLIGKEKINASNLVNLLVPILTILMLLILFYAAGRENIFSYLFSLYVAYGLSFTGSLLLVLKHFGTPGLTHLHEQSKVIITLFKYGFLNQIAHITQMMSFRLSYYVLESFHGEAAVGIYSNGVSLAESIWLISKSISLVQYARIANSENKEYAIKLTGIFIKISTLISFIILIPLVVLPGSVYVFIFGSEFYDVGRVIQTLAIGVLVYNVSILLGHYFSGTGRYYINAVCSSLGLIVSVILFYILIPQYGYIGAGFASSISYLFTTLLLLIYYSREDKGWYKSLIIRKEDIEVTRREVGSLFTTTKRYKDIHEGE